MLLGKMRKAGVKNIKLHMGDARDLMDVLPERCVSKAFLLYPDPWPKLRHHRRRFVTPEHLEPLGRSLMQGAEFSCGYRYWGLCASNFAGSPKGWL